jgi:hypothetical protein
MFTEHYEISYTSTLMELRSLLRSSFRLDALEQKHENTEHKTTVWFTTRRNNLPTYRHRTKLRGLAVLCNLGKELNKEDFETGCEEREVGG